jgi:hypothetical protein
VTKPRTPLRARRDPRTGRGSDAGNRLRSGIRLAAGRGHTADVASVKHFVWIVILRLAASGSDAYYTNRNLHLNLHETGFQEHNPLMRPFVHNTTDLSLSFAASNGGLTFAEYRLLKRHIKLSNAVAAIDFAGHVWGATTSAEGDRDVRLASVPRADHPGRPEPTPIKPVD